MKKKNIILIINQLYGGGAQKVIANLSTELVSFYNVSLVVYNDLDKIVFAHSGDLIKIQLPFSEDTHNNSFIKRLIRFISLVRQLRKIKKEKQVDVAISFMEASNIVNVLSRRHEKLILSVRSYLSDEFKDHQRLRIFKGAIKSLYKKAQHIVVPSQLVQKDLEENFEVPRQKISLIYNYIDKTAVSKLVKEALSPPLRLLLENAPVIINVGRINSPKGQWLLPSVLKNTKKAVPAARLMILGEGPLKDQIIHRATESGLNVYQEGITTLSKDSEIFDYDIFLLGFIANPFPYLARSTIFIKSSIYEGFPNVIIEAMATGLPIISSDCASGPREILSPGSDINSKAVSVEYAEYGILVPPYKEKVHDEALFIDSATQAVITMLTDETRRDAYREKSLLRAMDYEKDIILKQWLKLIG